MTILENSEKVKEERHVKRNLEGLRLLVHRLKYTISPGDWEGETRTAFIIGEDFKAAERLLIEHMPKVKKFQIDEQGDSVIEIHGLTPEIKRRLYRVLKNEFDPVSPDNMRNRLRGQNVRNS